MLKPHSIKQLKDVVDWRLCVGCGACYTYCKKAAVELVNIPEVGIRPRIGNCSGCNDCLQFCPGYRVKHKPSFGGENGLIGDVLEVWEGAATDDALRLGAASGGIVSALAAYCLDAGLAKGVVQVGVSSSVPWENVTKVSRSREEVVGNSASRYAPASPCSGLGAVADSNEPHVFIGKPCDVYAAQAMAQANPKLADNLDLTISFCCAGTPSTEGTLDLVRGLGVDPQRVKSLRYRGNGWPGNFTVICDDGTEHSMSYNESWAVLSHYRTMRCHMCPDGIGLFADIACGDAWHEYPKQSNDPGLSLVVVRTEKGRKVLHDAMEKGCLNLRRVSADDVVAAQYYLIEKRQLLPYRQAAMKALGIPTTTFAGFSLGKNGISFRDGMKSALGTIRRAWKRKLWKRGNESR